MDPSRKTIADLAQKLARRDVARLRLSAHECVIAKEVLDAKQLLEGGFDTIGGLDQLKQEVYELTVLPLRRPDLFNKRGRLLSAPRGLLFYGPPGTGKMAKAIARESGATFINLRLSTLMDKYYGESNKLVAALFSLAHKLAPSIIFIDEIESLLRARGGTDEAPTICLKAEFMTLWDGLLTDASVSIMVVGVTNRVYDLDPAILRLPRQFEIPMPGKEGRAAILKLLLQGEDVDGSMDLDELAVRTQGYSGSDLKKMFRVAVMLPLRDVMRVREDKSLSALDVGALQSDSLRPVAMDDFGAAMDLVKPAATWPGTTCDGGAHTRTRPPRLPPL